MSGLPWYKCDPARFNDGMVGLSRSERGVYVTIINAIYIEGAPVKDDPVYWCAIFRCNEASWAKDRAALIAKGKLFSAPTMHGEPGLMNRRAEDELRDQFAFRSEQAARGAKGGAKSRRKPRVDKGLSRASASGKRPLSKRLATAKQIEREIHPLNNQDETPTEVCRSSEVGADGAGATVIPLGRERSR